MTATQVTLPRFSKRESIKSMNPVLNEVVMMLSWRKVCRFTRTAVNGTPMKAISKTDAFPHSILACCENTADNWSFTVKGRIEYFGRFACS